MVKVTKNSSKENVMRHVLIKLHSSSSKQIKRLKFNKTTALKQLSNWLALFPAINYLH